MQTFNERHVIPKGLKYAFDCESGVVVKARTAGE